jgi:ribonuclease III
LPAIAAEVFWKIPSGIGLSEVGDQAYGSIFNCSRRRSAAPSTLNGMSARPPQKKSKGPRRGSVGQNVPVHAGTESATSLNSLQQHLGYQFQDLDLLTLALTHSSFVYEERLGRAKTNGDEPNEPGTDNEQLEFLGDAVLGLAVTELLLREFPDRTEGELTRMRASIVSRKRMAELGEELQLSEALRLGKSAEAGEGRQKMAVLANTAEAVLGAVYLDVKKSADLTARAAEKALRTVRSLVEHHLVVPDLPAIKAALEAAPGRSALRDAKSQLQERVQAVGAGRLLYLDTGESGPAHDRRFTVEVRLETQGGQTRGLGTGEGGSKKEAQQAAATAGLDRWEQEVAVLRRNGLLSKEHPA